MVTTTTPAAARYHADLDAVRPAEKKRLG